MLLNLLLQQSEELFFPLCYCIVCHSRKIDVLIKVKKLTDETHMQLLQMRLFAALGD